MKKIIKKRHWCGVTRILCLLFQRECGEIERLSFFLFVIFEYPTLSFSLAICQTNLSTLQTWTLSLAAGECGLNICPLFPFYNLSLCFFRAAARTRF